MRLHSAVKAPLSHYAGLVQAVAELCDISFIVCNKCVKTCLQPMSQLLVGIHTSDESVVGGNAVQLLAVICVFCIHVDFVLLVCDNCD